MGAHFEAEIECESKDTISSVEWGTRPRNDNNQYAGADVMRPLVASPFVPHTSAAQETGPSWFWHRGIRVWCLHWFLILCISTLVIIVCRLPSYFVCVRSYFMYVSYVRMLSVLVTHRLL